MGRREQKVSDNENKDKLRGTVLTIGKRIAAVEHTERQRAPEDSTPSG